jgi:hypothetical protein
VERSSGNIERQLLIGMQQICGLTVDELNDIGMNE